MKLNDSLLGVKDNEGELSLQRYLLSFQPGLYCWCSKMFIKLYLVNINGKIFNLFSTNLINVLNG